MRQPEHTSTAAWYRPGSTVALVGQEVAIWLDLDPGHPLIAPAWNVVRAGGEPDDVLDVVVSAGLRAVPGFCLVDRRRPGRLVARGTARAWISSAAGEMQITGSGGWVDRELTDVTQVRMTRAAPPGQATPGQAAPGQAAPGQEASMRRAPGETPMLPVEIGIVLVEDLQVPIVTGSPDPARPHPAEGANDVRDAAPGADRALDLGGTEAGASDETGRTAGPEVTASAQLVPATEEVRTDPVGPDYPLPPPADVASTLNSKNREASHHVAPAGPPKHSQASPLTLPSYSTMPAAPSPSTTPGEQEGAQWAPVAADPPVAEYRPFWYPRPSREDARSGVGSPSDPAVAEPSGPRGGTPSGTDSVQPVGAEAAEASRTGSDSADSGREGDAAHSGKREGDTPDRGAGSAYGAGHARHSQRGEAAPNVSAKDQSGGGAEGTDRGAGGADEDEGGHTGLTVSREQLRASGVGIDGPLVQAARCPNGHISSAHADLCRVCESPMPPQPPFQIPRPVLGRLVLPGGDVVSLDRGVILGREPRLPAGWVGVQPHLVKLSNPDDDVSRQHVEIRLESFHVLVRDLGSQNGTELVSRDGERRTLRAHEPVPITPGTTISLAGVVDVTFEVTP